MNLFLPSDPRPVHFVGIAGAGMSALAMLALARGVAVTGSDRAPDGAPDLPGLGAKVLQGHDAALVDGARAVVVSAAIEDDHPEVMRARALGVPVVSRKQALGQLVAGSLTVGIAGTHGKTTTTVMATDALVEAGFDPTGLAGGRVEAWGGNARIGGDRVFVVEADEYDKAFLELHPRVAVVGNVEPDHLECYGNSLAELERGFVTFAARARTALIGTAGEGCDRVARAVAGRQESATGRIWRFGPGAADLEVRDMRLGPRESRARVRLPDGSDVEVRLRVPGAHNVLNAAAALGVVQALDGDVPAAARALERFGGVGRRFERLGEAAGATVVDDYAHHPTEVRAALAGARQAFPGQRLVAVFQPHLYSRTALLGADLGTALAAADAVFVTAVYGAREQPLPGVSGRRVMEAALGAGAEARYIADREGLLAALAETVRPGDVVLTLGAGDITTCGPDLLRRLAAR